MSITLCRYLATLIACGALTLAPPSYGSAATVPQAPAQTQSTPNTTYPQIVRISYVEGDVRISRGKENERTTGASWETAVADLPLETGFNLVTGPGGRAEIEFEDASTVYLDENSALAFNDLETTDGISRTELALLTGTATLHLHLRSPGETFFFRTSTGGITFRGQVRAYERVSSYLDAMAITPLKLAAVPAQTSPAAGAEEGKVHPPVQLETAIYRAQAPVALEKSGNSNAFADWDSWVNNRITARSAAMAAVMKASGLTSPLPGLADMNGQGTFFPCAPYGTCWEPADRPAPQSDGAWRNAPRSSAPVLQLAAFTPQVVAPQPIEHFERDSFFPCPPTTVHSMMARDPVTGRESVLYSSMDPATGPYDWAVCHAGSWIYRRHRYAWVAGNTRHHRCPVHWIKTGRSLAYVPIHPHDEKGKPPLNAVHGVYALQDKQGHSVERISLDAGSKMKLLDAPPKEFRSVSFPPLSRAGDPHVNAYRLAGTTVAGKASVVHEPGTSLTFNQKSQSFMIAKQTMQGNKNAPELRAFNTHLGNAQTHTASGRGFSGGGSHGSSSGGHSGGGGGGSHGGGSSGGGGSHGGSSGGGGSHGGGGGGGGGHH
jgi:hypothetical protein